jgi:spore germination protein GerM
VSLTLDGGVATANFSQELRAFGGDAMRARLIREQITRTLQQFPNVHKVQITIEGQTEPLLAP